MSGDSHMRRTHCSSELGIDDIGKRVVVQGWVNRLRDHGGVIFVDLRDRKGLLQIVFNPEVIPVFVDQIRQLRNEFVIAVEGSIAPRPEGTANSAMPTGMIEMVAERLEIINAAEPPVFPIEDKTTAEEVLRLRYRYLDLRRPIMQESLRTRHECMKYIRRYLDERDFVEVETPMLTKSTPEGARDYLVPSRANPGCFYALPQSPQLFKQLLMVSGFERYYQIARCFRDEDLRADRQPEFSQLDLEMSFVDERMVMKLMEDLMCGLFRSVRGAHVAEPFPVLTYQESMDRFGVDNPDLRFGLELFDVTDVARSSGFQVFKKTVESGGVVKGLNLPDGARLTRRELDDLTELVKEWGGHGLAWVKIQNGWSGSPAKFFAPGECDQIQKISGAREGSCLLFVADTWDMTSQVLGRLRLHLARGRDINSVSGYRFAWITEFPLVEFDPDEKRFVAVHHPFTAPHPDDISLMGSDPKKVRARSYDLVLNGQEIGGGSIRIHDPDLQMKMFDLLHMAPDAVREKFGFLLEALRYGAPSHGGIAMGLDRIIAILTGADSIREVIAFPKTQKATCLLTGAPDRVAPEQLRELHIRITQPPKRSKS